MSDIKKLHYLRMLARAAILIFVCIWLLPILCFPFVMHVAYFWEFWGLRHVNPPENISEFLVWIPVFITVFAMVFALFVIAIVLVHGFVIGVTRTLHPMRIFAQLRDRWGGRKIALAVAIFFAFSAAGYARFYAMTEVSADIAASDRIIAEVKASLPHAPASENRILGVIDALVDLGMIEKEDRFPSEAYDLTAWEGDEGWNANYTGQSWLNESLPKSAVDDMDALIQSTKPFDRAFRDVMARPGTGYPYAIENVSLAKDIAVLVSDYSGLSGLFHFNRARAEVSVLAGRDDEAVAYLRDNLVLAEDILTTPNALLMTMIAWDDLKFTLVWLERFSVLDTQFERGEAKWRELSELAASVEKRALSPDLSVKLELARAIHGMEEFKHMRIMDLQLVSSSNRIITSLAPYLEWHTGPYLERIFTYEQNLLRNLLVDWSSHAKSEVSWTVPAPLSTVAKIISKTLFDGVRRAELSRLRVRVSPFVLAVNAHYRQNKSYPENTAALRALGLEELLPLDPNNPGQRLMYQREGNGFKIQGKGDTGFEMIFDPEESHWPKIE